MGKDKEIQPGIYSPNELTNEKYHADGAIGSSGIKAFSECPAIYWHKYINPERETEDTSKYKTIGSYAHVSLLEPELFEAKYAIAPEMATLNKGKSNEKTAPMNKVHSDWKKFAEKADKESKEPMLFSEYKTVCQMTAMIKRNELANAVLTNGKAEMSFFAKCPDTGLMLKARPDYLVKLGDGRIYLVDYKTTAISLSNSQQSRHAFNLGRHVQAAHHKRVTELATGGRIDDVIYVTQMQEAPYLLRIYRMPEDIIKAGDDEVKTNLERMAECFESCIWPDYPQEIEDYIAPSWLAYQFE